MKQINRAIYFDMDGTIADLYSVLDWINKLENEDASPYLEAAPMWDMGELRRVLVRAKQKGWTIGVITWLSKDSGNDFKKKARDAKRRWLEGVGFDVAEEIHMIAYGTPKHRVANIKKAILVDDNPGVRKAWERAGGITIDPTRENIIKSINKIAYNS